MAATLVTNGSRAAAAAIGTPTTIYNANTYPNSFFVITIDISRMVTGEQLQLIVSVNFTGSQFVDRLIDETFTYIPPGGPHIQTPPILAPDYLTATINQLNGTGRLIPWILHRF
jgi:hypothetical protein